MFSIYIYIFHIYNVFPTIGISVGLYISLFIYIIISKPSMVIIIAYEGSLLLVVI